MNLTIRPSSSGKITTLQLTGAVTNALEAVELRESISASVDAGATWIVLDCAGLTMLTSLGLGIIVASHTYLRNRGGDLCLASVQPHVAESISVSQLTRIITIFDTTEEAVATFTPKKS